MRAESRIFSEALRFVLRLVLRKEHPFDPGFGRVQNQHHHEHEKQQSDDNQNDIQ